MRKLILTLTALASLTIASLPAMAWTDDDVDTDAIAQLVANPTSDLSKLSYEELTVAGEIAGQAYATAHPRHYSIGDYEIGEKFAYRHHLLGGAKIGAFRSAFFEALQATAN